MHLLFATIIGPQQELNIPSETRREKEEERVMETARERSQNIWKRMTWRTRWKKAEAVGLGDVEARVRTLMAVCPWRNRLH
jgi:hypothetical protein